MARPKKPAKGAGRPAASKRLYTLEVTLIGGPVTEKFVEANPVVSRTIQVRGDQSLADLHEAIYDAFDREEEHLYEFQFGKKPMDDKGPRYKMDYDDPLADDDEAGSASEATLDSLDLKKNQVFFYWFDFGDDWWHKIKVKAIDDEVPAGKYPKVTERVGASPPQYPDYDEEGDDEDEEDE